MDFTYLQKELDLIVAEGSAPGVDCSVYKEHEEVFRYSTGFNDIENKVEITRDELYIIFSMTKMLTCTCALQLFEKGAFNMDDLLANYMPEFSKMSISAEDFDVLSGSAVATGKTIGETVGSRSYGYAENPITIRHLFTMSAGFDYDLKSEGILNAVKEGKTSTRDIVGALSKTVLGFEPGTRYRYSLCHDIIGALIEIWSGMSFGEYMRENLLKPLGMNDTFFGVPKDEKRLSRLAPLYVKNGPGVYQKIQQKCSFNFTDDYESGGAGLISSTNDYALFLDALANDGVGKSGNKILSKTSIELMRSNQLNYEALEDFEKSRKGYGYGFGVRTHLDPKRSRGLSPRGEMGWGGAAGAYSLVDSQNKLSLTYFQHMHGWELSLETRLRDALYKSMGK